MCKQVDIERIRLAHRRIGPHIHVTPVLRSRTLNRWLGTELHLKCENLQRSGAFKFRGALNAVMSLAPEQAARGVVTHSSGNHGGALALAASIRGIPAYVIMPSTAIAVKRRAAIEYGADVLDCEPTATAREGRAREVQQATGASFVHPYDDSRVIAGQGTVGLEICEQVPDLDALIVPVGGGGLLSGVALAAKAANPRLMVLGAEPANADDARRSLKAGRLLPPEDPRTIADGLRTGLGALTFPIIRSHVDDIITATEEGIVDSMQILWERLKLNVEPSGAVPLAALMEHRERLRYRRIGIILSGGNTAFPHVGML